MESSARTRLPLVGNCSGCAGLCCVALAFDRSLGFAIDKPAGRRCPHLTSTDRCGVHARRAELGFSGCERYDCLGAGQRVTRLFEDESWQTDDARARVVFDAFRVLREVHELLEMLRATESLPLDASQCGARDRFLMSLERDDWTSESLRRFELLDEGGRVRSFLRSLGAVALRRPTRQWKT